MSATVSQSSYELSLVGEFRKSIWDKFRQGVKEYELIQDGDRIAVCISGGKDSMILAQCMMRYQRFSKTKFECVYLSMDPGYSAANREKIIKNCEALGLAPEIHDTKIFSSLEKEKNPCFLCARLRRGFLYKTSQELGCNKIALGHHFDDVIETIVMGMLYGSQVQTMMPKLHSENYGKTEVIRPLYLVREQSIIDWAAANGLSFIDCACRVSDAKAGGSSKRAEIKTLLADIRKRDPAVDMNIFRSVENVNLRTLISYHDGDEYHSFLDDYDRKG